MKKSILSSIFLFAIVFVAKATVFTVSNNTALPGSPGQYTTVAAAMSAASNGDTIYIQPSATTYGNFTVTKTLTFIGAGYNPQTTSGLRSEIGQVSFGNGSSNSKLLGLYTNGGVVMTNNFAVSNYTISRCQIGGNGTAINFNSGSPQPSGTIFFENNIYGEGFAGAISFSPNATHYILNNLFLQPNFGANIGGTLTNTIDYIKNNTFLCSGSAVIDMKNDVIENNIFYNNFPNNTNITNTFNNNYVFGTSTLPYGTNVGSGNITNTIPTFNVFVCGQTFTYTVDFRPAASHVCINGGTDGTDIGMTGGAAPMYRYAAPYPLTGEPTIPQVREITIPVSSVPAGGTLNINVKARKRD